MKTKLSVTLLALVALLGLTMSTMAQPGGGERGQRPNRGGEGRQWDPEAMRARMAAAMKQRLGATDEEWAVIAPRLEKVGELRRQSMTGGMGMMMGRGGMGNRGDRGERGQAQRGDGDRGERQRPQQDAADANPVQAKARALNDTLRNEDATPEQIQKALAELREAREQSQKELETAQASLREVLTLRQEAMLVAMGLLE